MGKALGALLVLFALASHALAQETVKVTASTLNVRSGPGTGYSTLGTVSSGQVYVRVATSGSWEKIWYGSSTGWVFGSYTTAVSNAKGMVTASSLNVRTGPGTGYASVGAAPNGSWWAVVGTSGSWKQIFFKGAARWVYGSYLSSGGGSTAPPPPPGGGGLPTSSAGFVQMPASGTGYYAYTSLTGHWGVPNLVYKLIAACAHWKSSHPAWPRMGIGDISLKYGGYFAGHASHQTGHDVDIRPVRVDGEGATSVGTSSYSHSRTLDWITQHCKTHLNVKVIFFDDAAIYNSLSYVQYWPNHFNHHHVRIW